MKIMSIVIKEETSDLIDVNCKDDEEFLLPLEDPLAIDDDLVKVEADVEEGREDVGITGIAHKSGIPIGTQATDLPSIQFKNEENRNVITKLPKDPCFICTLCHLGFHEKDLFQEHLNTSHSDVFKYPCRHCGKKFQWNDNRKRHETIHDKNRFEGEPKFACDKDKCDRKYHLKGSLESHVKMVHLGLKPKRKPLSKAITEHHSVGVRGPPKKRVKKVLQCPNCDLTFDMRCLLTRHLRVHSDARMYNCQFCGQRFKSLGSKYTHIRNVHQNPSASGRPKFLSGRPRKCKICGKIFAIPSRLNKHMKIHSEERRFKCKDCGMRFKADSDLQRHVKVTHAQNNMLQVKCTICGREFKQFSVYNHHRKVHSSILYGTDKEKAFGCTICGKPYFTRAEAAVCTVFRHDPSSLQKQMFRFKCNMCPPEKFGYHSLIALRNHWALEHEGVPLPVQYRVGMYDGNGNEKPIEDVLPKVVVPKVDATKLRETGIPPVKLEHPLYVEFDLVQVDEKILKKERKQKERKVPERVYCPVREKPILERKKNYKIFSCISCGKTFCKAKQLKLHMKNMHRPKGKRGRPKKKRRHLRSKSATGNASSNEEVNSGVEPKRKRGRPRKILHQSSSNPGQSDNVTTNGNVKIDMQDIDGRYEQKDLEMSLDTLGSTSCHQHQVHGEVTIHDRKQTEKMNRDSCRVNVNDKEAILSVLGYRVVKVQISRLNLP